MSDPRNQINWTDEWLAASIFVCMVLVTVFYIPSIVLWITNQ